MPDITLITSLYKTEAFLPRYSAHLLQIGAQARAAHLDLEVVMIPNAASDVERQQLEALQEAVAASGDFRLQVLHVPLETLHASWNRGVRAAHGRMIGFWNVDDVRHIAGLCEGHDMAQTGAYDLIDFPVDYRISRKFWGRIPYTQQQIKPPQYRPAPIHPKNGTGPFFLFAPALYERNGGFDEGFPIAGDFEWCMRPAVRGARIGYGEQVAGVFYLHGDNITQAHALSDWVAFNVALLRQGAYAALRPVNPQQMREAWATWGDDGTPVPDAVQAQLWGDGATERWQAWERAYARTLRRQDVRRVGRMVLDRLRVRPVLARLGLVGAEPTS